MLTLGPALCSENPKAVGALAGLGALATTRSKQLPVFNECLLQLENLEEKQKITKHKPSFYVFFLQMNYLKLW